MTAVLLCLVATVATWGFMKARTSAAIARAQDEMRKEIRYWQEKAARANTRINQLERDAATWAAGCKQGRDDVITVVPLLIAAQERQSSRTGGS